MNNQVGINLRFTGPLDLEPLLKSMEEKHLDEFKVINTSIAKDASQLKLGMGEIADILTIIQSGVVLIQLSAALFRAFQARKLKHIVITGPTKRIELVYSKDMREEHVLTAIKSLLPVKN